MITADPLPVFPTCPAFGFTVEPVILARHIITESGYERSVRLWDQALRQFSSVPIGERLEADIEQILAFWLAVGGTWGRFRFIDYADYRSADLGNDITALDQPIEAGSDGSYQLVKDYSFGTLTHRRTIHRPLGSTVLIANEVGVAQDPDTWTIDEATGELVPESAFGGTPTFWGGEFHVYARFSSELPIEISSVRIQATAFTVREVRE
jgi:uncharacterized protein (TIGR02217 family)